MRWDIIISAEIDQVVNLAIWEKIENLGISQKIDPSHEKSRDFEIFRFGILQDPRSFGILSRDLGPRKTSSHNHLCISPIVFTNFIFQKSYQMWNWPNQIPNSHLVNASGAKEPGQSLAFPVLCSNHPWSLTIRALGTVPRSRGKSTTPSPLAQFWPFPTRWPSCWKRGLNFSEPKFAKSGWEEEAFYMLHSILMKAVFY